MRDRVFILGSHDSPFWLSTSLNWEIIEGQKRTFLSVSVRAFPGKINSESLPWIWVSYLSWLCLNRISEEETKPPDTELYLIAIQHKENILSYLLLPPWFRLHATLQTQKCKVQWLQTTNSEAISQYKLTLL